jgi:ketosteroid isomerase-like protein
MAVVNGVKLVPLRCITLYNSNQNLHKTMKKTLLFLLLTLSSFLLYAQDSHKIKINQLIDNWHKAAAEANFNAYFDMMADDAIFIGTDATENWNKKAFQAYSKPYFDKGKAWSFTSLERHIYFSKDGKTAWFDELLNTQMKICRGSGVLEKVKDNWKIKHYVLSMTVPNDNSDEVVKLKSPLENPIIDRLKK